MLCCFLLSVLSLPQPSTGFCGFWAVLDLLLSAESAFKSIRDGV